MVYALTSRRFESALKVLFFVYRRNHALVGLLKRQYKRKIEVCVFASHQEAADGYEQDS